VIFSDVSAWRRRLAVIAFIHLVAVVGALVGLPDSVAFGLVQTTFSLCCERDLATGGMSVCLSVRPSVTRWY